MKNKASRDKYMAIIQQEANRVQGYDRYRGWIKKVLDNPNQQFEVVNKFAKEAARRLGIDNDE
jgi:hypothetical protein